MSRCRHPCYVVKAGKSCCSSLRRRCEALFTLIVNRLRGTFTCVAVKAWLLAIAASDMLRDIATWTRRYRNLEEVGIELTLPWICWVLPVRSR